MASISPYWLTLWLWVNWVTPTQSRFSQIQNLWRLQDKRSKKKLCRCTAGITSSHWFGSLLNKVMYRYFLGPWRILNLPLAPLLLALVCVSHVLPMRMSHRVKDPKICSSLKNPDGAQLFKVSNKGKTPQSPSTIWMNHIFCLLYK